MSGSRWPGRGGGPWVPRQEAAAGGAQGHPARSWASAVASGSPSHVPARVRARLRSEPAHVGQLIPTPPRGGGTWWGLPCSGGGPGVLAGNLGGSQVPRSGRTGLAQPQPLGLLKNSLFLGVLFPKARRGAGEGGLGDEPRGGSKGALVYSPAAPAVGLGRSRGARVPPQLPELSRQRAAGLMAVTRSH